MYQEVSIIYRPNTSNEIRKEIEKAHGLRPKRIQSIRCSNEWQYDIPNFEHGMMKELRDEPYIKSAVCEPQYTLRMLNGPRRKKLMTELAILPHLIDSNIGD